MADRSPLREVRLLTPEGLKRMRERQEQIRAQRREFPTTFVKLEPMPLAAYDDNPVFDETSASRFLGISQACLKKWRQREQGPDYIQYGTNGPVRYELSALQEFRDRDRVRLGY